MKLFLIFLTVCSSFLASAKPSENPSGSEKALQCFKTSFVSASDVSWSYSNNLYKASFLLNGQHATAYYDADGAFMELPATLVPYSCRLLYRQH